MTKKTCACGAHFLCGRLGSDNWHCQCPPCERYAIGITVRLAQVLDGTVWGAFLRRLVDARWFSR